MVQWSGWGSWSGSPSLEATWKQDARAHKKDHEHIIDEGVEGDKAEQGRVRTAACPEPVSEQQLDHMHHLQHMSAFLHVSVYSVYTAYEGY